MCVSGGGGSLWLASGCSGLPSVTLGSRVDRKQGVWVRSVVVMTMSLTKMLVTTTRQAHPSCLGSSANRAEGGGDCFGLPSLIYGRVWPQAGCVGGQCGGSQHVEGASMCMKLDADHHMASPLILHEVKDDQSWGGGFLQRLANMMYCIE